MKKYHVCVVTGTRAEFGIWSGVLGALHKAAKLRTSLVVTGMHLQKQFGNTIKDIVFPIAARVPMYRADEPPAKSLARATDGLAAAFRALAPDLVLVLGDRLEMLAAGNAALAERIPLAHVHGGESAPGIWDEQIRHALTKMSHLHFCATKAARQRIVRMGEDPKRVHLVGAPALDSAAKWFAATRESLAAQPASVRKIWRKQAPILLLHPGSPDQAIEYRQARMLISLLRAHFSDAKIAAIGPNNDPGHQGILRAYREAGDDLVLTMSLPQFQFWDMLYGSQLLIGNSSSGIIEAASFGVPVINIGTRQAGRERNANVIDVGWDRRAIERALRKATSDVAFLRQTLRRRNLYGDGRARERIVGVLEKVAREGVSLVKRFAD
jgi:UDP-hydrolysing UDP-N-acetyl-D-glucosamine 2-epimerase